MNIKDLVVCKFTGCNQIFDDARFLPCGKRTCAARKIILLFFQLIHCVFKCLLFDILHIYINWKQYYSGHSQVASRRRLWSKLININRPSSIPRSLSIITGSKSTRIDHGKICSFHYRSQKLLWPHLHRGEMRDA